MKLTEFPHLVKEWHPTKNGDLRPEDVTHGSKKKVWWLCPKGHSYQAKPNTRSAGNTGCPYCSGKLASKDNNLLLLFPDIAKEWHPNKNGDLAAKDVTFGTSKKVWWLCSDGHSFQSSVNRRTSMKTQCPICLGRKVSDDNNLKITHPEISKEWDLSKNKGLCPEHFTYGSKKKIWWNCLKGHQYQMIIKNRTIQNQGCPQCTKQSSLQELRILSEFKKIFKVVESRKRFKGREIDIYLPNYLLGIEYDGSYWHREKEEKDIEKNKFFEILDIKIIRVREKPLNQIDALDVLVDNKQIIKNDIDNLLVNLKPFVSKEDKLKIEKYLSKKSFANESLYKEYVSYFPSPLPENTLLSSHSYLVNEWDFDKNFPLKPDNFSYGSSYKVWWLCEKGHSYEAVIANKSRGTGCPYCSGRKSLTPDLFES